MIADGGISVGVRYANGSDLIKTSDYSEGDVLNGYYRVPSNGLDLPIEVLVKTSRVGKRYTAYVNYAGANLEPKDFKYNGPAVFKALRSGVPIKTQPQPLQELLIEVLVKEYLCSEIVGNFKLSLTSDAAPVATKEPKARAPKKKPSTKRAAKPNRSKTGRRGR